MNKNVKNLIVASKKVENFLYDTLLEYVKKEGKLYADNSEYYINELGIEDDEVTHVLEFECDYVHTVNAKENDFEYNSIVCLYVTKEYGVDKLEYYCFYNDGTELDEDGCEPYHGSASRLTLDEMYHIYTTLIGDEVNKY